MTPMRHSFVLLNKLLASPRPEQHLLEIRTLIEELAERARDSAEAETASDFGIATLSYLRGIGHVRPEVEALRRREVEQRAEALASMMFRHRGQRLCSKRAQEPMKSESQGAPREL